MLSASLWPKVITLSGFYCFMYIQWKLRNMITLGQRATDSITQMITITSF
jgi:hypothetical protein